MAAGTRARSPEELTEIINQALDEVEDMRAAIEYDEEFQGESNTIVEPAAVGLRRLLATVNNDDYQPGEGDWLQFIDALREIDHGMMPFWPLLALILETHKYGYQEEDE